MRNQFQQMQSVRTLDSSIVDYHGAIHCSQVNFEIVFRINDQSGTCGTLIPKLIVLNIKTFFLKRFGNCIERYRSIKQGVYRQGLPPEASFWAGSPGLSIIWGNISGIRVNLVMGRVGRTIWHGLTGCSQRRPRNP